MSHGGKSTLGRGARLLKLRASCPQFRKSETSSSAVAYEPIAYIRNPCGMWSNNNVRTARNNSTVGNNYNQQEGQRQQEQQPATTTNHSPQSTSKLGCEPR